MPTAALPMATNVFQKFTSKREEAFSQGECCRHNYFSVLLVIGSGGFSRWCFLGPLPGVAYPYRLFVTVSVTILGNVMKKQTGVRIESAVWQAFRALCSRDRVHPSQPIEEFVKIALDNGSTLGLLTLMKGAAKVQAEGVNAYARILLNWYTHGKRWFHTMGEDDAPVEGLLLEVLKTVTDTELRQQIEDALTPK
jgi:hypothetical protein